MLRSIKDLSKSNVISATIPPTLQLQTMLLVLDSRLRTLLESISVFIENYAYMLR